MRRKLSATQISIRGALGLLLGLSIMLLSLFALGTIRDQADFMSSKFQNKWTVEINGEPQTNVDLSEFSIEGKLPKDSEIVMTNNLPKNLTEGMTLRVLIYLATVDVYVDGDCIYSYGSEELSSGTLVGSGYHFITLPDDCAGQEIVITFHTAENEAFTNIPIPMIYPTEYAYIGFANSNMPQIFVGTFLFVAGLIISIIAGVAIFYNRTYDRLFLMGVLSLLVGAWSMSNGKVLQVFAVDLAHQTAAEYACLYLAPIPLMLLIIKMNTNDNIFKKLLLWFPLAFMLVFNIVAAILQATNVCHYPKTLKVFHFLCLLLVVCAVIGSSKKFTLMDNSEKLLNIAIVVLCAFGGLDVIRFNVSKYLFPKSAILKDTILPYGMLLFVLLLLVSYLLYVYAVVEEKAKTYALQKIAYHDALTGLYNRAKSDDIFEELVSKGKDYYLVNIDVNGLKNVNDTYGHAKGDTLIIQFAAILRSSFGGIGTIIRMGGDEFLVVVDDINADQIKPALRRMMELEEIRTKQLGFPVEASFGVATNKEEPDYKPEQVYSIADSRMYEMKIKSKNARRKK